MKKTYVSPSIATYIMNVEGMMRALSMDNGHGDVQTNIKDDDRDDFTAGGKKNNFNAWSTWDDDDE